MNENRIVTARFSNPDSERRYRNQWSDEPELVAKYEEGGQCGGCAYFAPFNSDWGLCCNADSRHMTETVFEHFTCSALVDEGWGAHSFSGFPRAGRDHTGDLETDPPTVSLATEPGSAPTLTQGKTTSMIAHTIAFEQLTAEERIALIGRLWDSLDPAVAAPLSDELAAELDRREAEADANSEAGELWESLKSQLRDKLR